MTDPRVFKFWSVLGETDKLIMESLEAVRNGKYDDIIAEGRKLDKADRVELLNDLDVSLNSINEFIAENDNCEKL